MEDLFKQIWHRRNNGKKSHQEEAAKYFHFAMQGRCDSSTYGRDNYLYVREARTVFECTVATKRQLQEKLVHPKDAVSTEDLLKIRRVTKARITVRCAGLLEITHDAKTARKISDYSQEADSTLHELRILHWPTTVNFIHRSVRDFLQKSKPGQDILGFSKHSSELETLLTEVPLDFIRQHVLRLRPVTLRWVDSI